MTNLGYVSYIGFIGVSAAIAGFTLSAQSLSTGVPCILIALLASSLCRAVWSINRRLDAAGIPGEKTALELLQKQARDDDRADRVAAALANPDTDTE